MRRLLLAGAVCTLLLPANRSVRADGPSYTVRNLGTFSGAVPQVTGINASGVISGWYSDWNIGDRALRYTDADGWKLIPGLESLNSYAFGINDDGAIVGYAVMPDFSVRGFRYTDAGGVEFIAPLPGGNMTMAMGISNTGEITGYSTTATATRAFRQSPGLLAQAIDTVGGPFSGGCGINDSGEVAGFAFTSGGIMHGFRATVDGNVVDIPGLAGAASQNSACAIDATGAVTGSAATAAGAQHAFLYSAGTLVDLDSFGSLASRGAAISNGTVVGNFLTADGLGTHAFKYSAATGTVDLNAGVAADSGWVLTSATGLNAKGTIAGQGTMNGVDAAWEITTADTIAPTIASVSVSPSTMVPNHHMVPVTVSVSAADNVDPQPSCSITSIGSAQAGPGDSAITGALTASVFAEKDSRGAARVYTLTVTCSDAARNTSSAQVSVEVSAGNSAAAKAKSRD